jgi:hypothetical protein
LRYQFFRSILTAISPITSSSHLATRARSPEDRWLDTFFVDLKSWLSRTASCDSRLPSKVDSEYFALTNKQEM